MSDFLVGLGYERWVLNTLLVLPLVGAFAVLALPERRAKHVALAVALAEFVVSIGLWWAFDPTTSAMQLPSPNGPAQWPLATWRSQIGSQNKA